MSHLGEQAYLARGRIHDVHFAAGQYAPGTKEGDRLLAHELTHVVQGQKSGVQRKAEKERDRWRALYRGIAVEYDLNPRPEINDL